MLLRPENIVKVFGEVKELKESWIMRRELEISRKFASGLDKGEDPPPKFKPLVLTESKCEESSSLDARSGLKDATAKKESCRKGVKEVSAQKSSDSSKKTKKPLSAESTKMKHKRRLEEKVEDIAEPKDSKGKLRDLESKIDEYADQKDFKKRSENPRKSSKSDYLKTQETRKPKSIAKAGPKKVSKSDKIKDQDPKIGTETRSEDKKEVAPSCSETRIPEKAKKSHRPKPKGDSSLRKKEEQKPKESKEQSGKDRIVSEQESLVFKPRVEAKEFVPGSQIRDEIVDKMSKLSISQASRRPQPKPKTKPDQKSKTSRE